MSDRDFETLRDLKSDRIANLRDQEEICREKRSTFREPVCIHTDQVYDSCRERDCLRNLRVFFTSEGQEIVNRAINVKVKQAEVIWVYTDVNRSMYKIYKNFTPHCKPLRRFFSAHFSGKC